MALGQNESCRDAQARKRGFIFLLEGPRETEGIYCTYLAPELVRTVFVRPGLPAKDEWRVSLAVDGGVRGSAARAARPTGRHATGAARCFTRGWQPNKHDHQHRRTGSSCVSALIADDGRHN
jgi:hypothetical protein